MKWSLGLRLAVCVCHRPVASIKSPCSYTHQLCAVVLLAACRVWCYKQATNHVLGALGTARMQFIGQLVSASSLLNNFNTHCTAQSIALLVCCSCRPPNTHQLTGVPSKLYVELQASMLASSRWAPRIRSVCDLHIQPVPLTLALGASAIDGHNPEPVAALR